MKVDEFLHPAQMTVEEVIAEVEKETEFVTSLTPSGIECWYSWSPRRHYKLRRNVGPHDQRIPNTPWIEVPSVTTVLNVLDKSGAISWWAMRCGISAVIELDKRKILPTAVADYALPELERLVVDNKLSINHQTASAATRGVNVHSAFEKWAEDQSYRPIVDTYPETEQGYIRGLISFLDDLGEVEDVESEVMVGSIQHGFAGRYDLRFTSTPAFDEKSVVTKVYPKREAKRSVLPTGKFLVDLKTSKGIYPTHALQLAAYEMASVECGYGATDHRAVVHVTANGNYELVLTHATSEDFLSVLTAHNTMSKSKGWT